MMRQMQTNGNKSIELIDTHFITSEKVAVQDRIYAKVNTEYPCSCDYC